MEKPNQNLTRGTLLQRIAVAPIAIGAFAALAAEADAKAPQKAVMYQDNPKDGKKCSQCKFYIDNAKDPKAKGGCTQVDGAISPNGWCVVYSAGPHSGNKAAGAGGKMQKKGKM
ncbi:MAG: hypothetical protein NVSMB19_13560 [Vulcanimicrobiaceae bacterium]